jgi:hypothetical protein
MSRNAIIHSFYCSLKWQAFRNYIISSRGPVCECCGKTIPTPHNIIIHHMPTELTVDNVSNPAISLNENNVKIFARDCHDRAHHRFSKPTGKKVYIVYGMPCSGKTSYVVNNKNRNDIVVDMDRLYEAITLLPAYDKPDQLFSVVRDAHNHLLDKIKTRFGKWETAWIVGGFPEQYARDRMADELGAELIYCECDKLEAMARLAADPVRSRIQNIYESYIDRWLEKYS